MLPARFTYLILTSIVLAYLIVAILYAINTPPWQAPDEPAHYNYIAQVVRMGCCPVIERSDWNNAYLAELTAEQFPEEADLSTLTYQDHQPPLYYLIGSLIYRVSLGSVLALRIMSIAFGAGIVVAAFFVVSHLCPGEPIAALASAMLVAFIPQHLAILASVNNDSLAGMVMGIIMVVSLSYLRNPVSQEQDGSVVPRDISTIPHSAALGGLLGIAYLTKLTIYLPATFMVAVTILLRWRNEKASWRWLAEQLVWAGGLALIVGSLWWGRNIVVYGWPDLFAQAAHTAAVEGQLETSTFIRQVGLGTYMGELAKVTYHSFWGQFGWMAVPMQPRVYLLIGFFMVISLVGTVILWIRYGETLRKTPIQQSGLWALCGLSVAVIAGYVYYNLTFVQFQGRYLYPLLIPFAMALVAGWYGWASLAGYRADEKGGRSQILKWVPLLAVSWLPILAVYALYRYVIPFLG